MKISQKEVHYVAHLARLELSAKEAEQYTVQLDHILSYIDKLNQADTTGTEAMTHAMPLSNAFREDDITPSLTNEASLANAPETRAGSFRVPKVIE